MLADNSLPKLTDIIVVDLKVTSFVNSNLVPLLGVKLSYGVNLNPHNNGIISMAI